MRLNLFILLFCLGLCRAGAANSPLLNRAMEKWMDEGDHWAFTMRVREFDNGGVKEERVEQYDPSRRGPDRWKLVTVDGQAPTAARRADWQRAKARKHWKTPRSLSEFFDFENVKVAGATPSAIRYIVPLHSNRSWLFPIDRVALTVTVNKASRAIEEVQAGIDEPYHVAFGMARIIDVDFDVKMNPSRERGAVAGPATAQPAGRAHVAIARLGERIEYTWSDFRRVTPAPELITPEPPES